MVRTTFSRFHRLLIIGLCSIILASISFFGANFAPTPAAAAGPDINSIQCGGLRNPPSAFTVHNGGGYTGLGASSTCDGAFSYVLTPTSASVTWPEVVNNPSQTTTLKLNVWAYIPNVDAGAVVDYYVNIRDDTSTQSTKFSSGFNQENATGWTVVGVISIPGGDQLVSISMSSGQQAHWDMAEDSLGISCTNASCT